MRTITITIHTRMCCECHLTYRSADPKPSCPNCDSTLSIVIDTRSTSEPSFPDHRKTVFD